MSFRLATILAFVLTYSLIVFRWLYIPIADTNTEARVGVYGDAFSSRNVHSAAMWFKDMGYTKTKALPVFNYTGNFNQEGVEVYTHYPPLPDILGGLYARLLNTKDPHVLAAVVILISIVFFFLLQRILAKIIPGKNAAFISWILLVTSCYFICWADDLHQHLYTELLKWIYIYILYRYLAETPRSWMLPVLCLVYFLQSLLTFESIPFLAIVTLGFFYIFKKRVLHPVAFLLLLMPMLGVALHIFQNYLYLGGWDAVLADLKAALLKRTTGTGELSNELGRPVQGYDFAKMWIYEFWFRLGRMFTLPAISFIVIAWLALRDMYLRHRLQFKIAIVFLLSGVAWIFVMPQHAMIHTFTIKHMAVFFASLAGYGVCIYWKLLKDDLHNKKYYWWIFHFLLIGYSVYGFAYNQFYYVYLKFGFAYPHLGTDAHLW